MRVPMRGALWTGAAIGTGGSERDTKNGTLRPQMRVGSRALAIRVGCAGGESKGAALSQHWVSTAVSPTSGPELGWQCAWDVVRGWRWRARKRVSDVPIQVGAVRDRMVNVGDAQARRRRIRFWRYSIGHFFRDGSNTVGAYVR
jgi:hypothetical protein